MTFLFNILSLIFFFATITLVVQNLQQPVEVLAATYILEMKLGLALGISGLLLALAVGFKMMDMAISNTFKQFKTNRKAEKLEVTSEEAQQKITALEAKVSTLEAALDKALTSKDTSATAVEPASSNDITSSDQA